MSTHDLRASMEALSRSRRGDHPDPEDLLAYHLGELDVDRAEAVEEHVTLCSDCARHVLDMADFLAGEPPEEAEAVSDADAERLSRVVGDALDAERAGGSAAPPFYATLGFARAAAVAFLLLSAGLAARLAVAPSGSERPEPTMANLPIVELRAAETRGPGERDEVRLPESAAGAVLVFPVAETGAFSSYSVTVEKTDGEVILRRSDLRRTDGGLLTLAVPRDALAPGSYRLRISGTGPGAEPRPLATFGVDWRTD